MFSIQKDWCTFFKEKLVCSSMHVVMLHITSDPSPAEDDDVQTIIILFAIQLQFLC